MKKKTLALILTLCMTVTAVVSFAAGAVAAGGLQEVRAYLNANISLKVDGQEKVITDATGVRTYPITYNETTYLPVRSIASLLGIEVGWDQATQSVLLGKQPGGGVDLIDTYKAYATSQTYQYQTADGKTKNIGGVDVDHWLHFDDPSGRATAHFNLGGRYDSITFQVYATGIDTTLTIYGDEGAVLAEIPVTGQAVPKTVTVPLFNATELFFDSKSYYTDVYVFDAKLS